ncbi:hypothetical protein [Rathayibacter sp. AY1B7]|uniref:hypothetical protein n=1 Tax=Rathayibacter sp. AY1B7 TaxID=2080532 RepID=UPI0011B01FD8|nr:hypothetical protein [Rathayibacter sp. AY1B7]
MSEAEHHLVLVTRLWAEGPSVVGIYSTREDAESSVTEAASEGASPDRYHCETWRGGRRIT